MDFFCAATDLRAFVNWLRGSERAAFPASVVRDLEKDWIRAPTETNNGSYERRGEGRPNANIHFVRFGKAALNSVNRKPEWVFDGKGQESATSPASFNTDSQTRSSAEGAQTERRRFVSWTLQHLWNVPDAPAEGQIREVGTLWHPVPTDKLSVPSSILVPTRFFFLFIRPSETF